MATIDWPKDLPISNVALNPISPYQESFAPNHTLISPRIYRRGFAYFAGTLTIEHTTTEGPDILTPGIEKPETPINTNNEGSLRAFLCALSDIHTKVNIPHQRITLEEEISATFFDSIAPVSPETLEKIKVGSIAFGRDRIRVITAKRDNGIEMFPPIETRQNPTITLTPINTIKVFLAPVDAETFYHTVKSAQRKATLPTTFSFIEVP